MKEYVLMSKGGKLIKVDARNWRNHLEERRHAPSTHLSFMTQDHHRVRNLAVSELPRNHGKPLGVQEIASRLKLSPSWVLTILDDLQQHLFFIVLNAAGEVSWAYPVTVEKTPHRLSFSTGEHIFAA